MGKTYGHITDKVGDYKKTYAETRYDQKIEDLPSHQSPISIKTDLNDKTNEPQENKRLAKHRFFGTVRPREEARGEPIPGYTGAVKRMDADPGIVGVSYGMSLRMSQESHRQIVQDGKANFREQVLRTPPLKR
eukprot:TRINITY_DN2387_c0_g1_i9.p1 TRINITY_DN2387_c0_g1~~TRINITY_DN2387_c0_g1_i9.p1  ORF type:complete len:133 (-),score=8.18 TRINITY_DN2387_c0_g1_i9:142-540(-)